MAYKGQAAPTTSYQVYRAKVSDGKSVKVAVPASTTIDVNSFYELGGFFGPAFQSVKTKAGETSEVVLNIEQAEYETNQIQTTEDFAAGDPVYFADGKFTTDPTDAPRLVGRVTEGKDQNNVIWFILGPQV
ncbi:DUF2190 family protein [Sporosarcina sp. FSL K6-1508]|uniref:DUF2190 family protein n=1 Tax=Sporosarcina sp. FSL K6-1508 TaxID=2921553 RepID=UPI0030F6EE51